MSNGTSPATYFIHVHQLKLLKRQAYGRASFDQLRKGVLCYA